MTFGFRYLHDILSWADRLDLIAGYHIENLLTSTIAVWFLIWSILESPSILGTILHDRNCVAALVYFSSSWEVCLHKLSLRSWIQNRAELLMRVMYIQYFCLFWSTVDLFLQYLEVFQGYQLCLHQCQLAVHRSSFSFHLHDRSLRLPTQHYARRGRFLVRCACVL